MTDILVHPSELRQISEQLRASAKKVGLALQTIDNDISSLKGSAFLGNRADALQKRYAPKRNALLRAREIVAHFAEDLQDAANTFEHADQDLNGNLTFRNQEPGELYASLFPWTIVNPSVLMNTPEYKVKVEIEGKYKDYLIKYSKEYGVPYNYLLNVIIKERLDYGLLGSLKDSWGKMVDDKGVSLGVGQIEIRRAAELEQPNRDWDKNPLTKEEIDKYESKLESPEANIKILSMELSDNYKTFGKIEGKTEEDHWKFALAMHKSGQGPIGEAQQLASDKGANLNRWDDVSPYLKKDIRDFVDFVTSTPTSPIGVSVA